MSSHVNHELALRARVLLAGSEPPTPWQAYQAHRLLARVNPVVHLPKLALAAIELTRHHPVLIRRDLQLQLLDEALDAASRIPVDDPYRPRALARILEEHAERLRQLGITPS
ncbi:hypothetical protein [Kitasatospora sp. CB01950]|uniref:hypothetical protein n=1 Tax=Kitasatospora sp. CB01950 TaxID=1703930 RepID=UPI000939A86B|nr:hypothetical protein [Kitasatospora sp. CB01950]OKJ13619.1 hypothetical protein AMK19_09200 [Kitasatospora sp. CB01950]